MGEKKERKNKKGPHSKNGPSKKTKLKKRSSRSFFFGGGVRGLRQKRPIYVSAVSVKVCSLFLDTFSEASREQSILVLLEARLCVFGELTSAILQKVNFSFLFVSGLWIIDVPHFFFLSSWDVPLFQTWIWPRKGGFGIARVRFSFFSNFIDTLLLLSFRKDFVNQILFIILPCMHVDYSAENCGTFGVGFQRNQIWQRTLQKWNALFFFLVRKS